MIKTKIVAILGLCMLLFLPVFFLKKTGIVEAGKENQQNTASSTTVQEGVGVALYGDNILKIGEKVQFPKNSIMFTKVLEDSRCPEGVQCFWAGTVKLEMEITSNNETRTTGIEIGKEFSLGGETVTVTNVTPHPKSGLTIPQNDYVITIVVQEGTSTTTVDGSM